MERPLGDDNDFNSTSPEPDLKRKKLRKGTRSCWDCKRRKVKCTFKSTTDAACISCLRRGVACVGQEYPEESYGEYNRGQLFERVVRVESLLENLVEKVEKFVDRDGNSAVFGPPQKSKPVGFTAFSDVQSTNTFVSSVSVTESMRNDFDGPTTTP